VSRALRLEGSVLILCCQPKRISPASNRPCYLCRAIGDLAHARNQGRKGKPHQQIKHVEKLSYFAWRIIALFGVGLVALVIASLTFRRCSGVPGWINFLTTNILSLLLLCVVVVQAYIYSQQKRLMQSQLDVMSIAIRPRLRVASVKVKDFEEGKSPVFVMSLVNEGATEANDVAIFMQVRIGPGDADGAKWGGEQIVTIPANGRENYFVPLPRPLSEEDIYGFNNTVRLEVSGYYRQTDAVDVPFCYKYYPWHGERPRGVSQFIACDFDPSLTVQVSRSDTITLTSSVTAIHIKAGQRDEKGGEEPATQD
jgi:hypothetical protein